MIKIKQILIVSFILVALFLGYTYLTEEDKLSISVGGSVVNHPLEPAEVFGAVEDIEYSQGDDAFVLLPGQKVTMNVAAYNPYTSSTGLYYKAWVYDDWRLIWTSDEVFLMPDGIKEWFFTYNAPSGEGVVEIYIESAVKDPFGSYGYVFDDLDSFHVITRSDAPPDPCEGVSCPSKCIGETYYYAGYCVDGTCVYSKALVPGKCGYTIPVPEPDEPDEPDDTPVPDDTPTPDPVDPCEGKTCPDICVEPYTWKSDGVCIDGNCEYKEESDSTECGYVESTSPTPDEDDTDLTITPTVTDGPKYSTPVGDVPDDTATPEEPLNVYIVGAVLLLLIGATFLYIRERDQVIKMLGLGQCDPEDKAEYIETFAPKNRAILLKTKVTYANREEHYQLENIAGLWELRGILNMPASRRYELMLNNGHKGYFPSIIQASRTIAGLTYNELFI